MVCNSISIIDNNTLLPVGYKPQDTDIICGRGRVSPSLKGNMRFTEAIRGSLDQYSQAPSRIDKSIVVASVVCSLRNEGLQFIKQDKASKRFSLLSDDQIHEKTGHAIRDVLKHMKSKPAKKANAKNAKNAKNAGGKRGKKRKSPSAQPSQQSQQSQSFTIHNTNIITNTSIFNEYNACMMEKATPSMHPLSKASKVSKPLDGCHMMYMPDYTASEMEIRHNHRLDQMLADTGNSLGDMLFDMNYDMVIDDVLHSKANVDANSKANVDDSDNDYLFTEPVKKHLRQDEGLSESSIKSTFDSILSEACFLSDYDIEDVAGSGVGEEERPQPPRDVCVGGRRRSSTFAPLPMSSISSMSLIPSEIASSDIFKVYEILETM